MKNTQLLPLLWLAAAVIGLAVIALVLKRISGRGQPGTIQARKPLTLNEQPMYFRLCEAAPAHVVLAQVAFSALLHSKDRTTRNRFDRKVADFVVCTRSFDVLAVVELDDSSHRGREVRDAARASLLTNAGYRVLRYKSVPDLERVKADLQTPPSTMAK